MRYLQKSIVVFVRLMLAGVMVAGVMCQADAASAARKRASGSYSPPQATIVADGLTGKILHSLKADEPRYPASLTKVMTLYLVFEFLREGRIALTTEMAVTAKAASQPPTKLFLKEGETITVKDAIRALITKSANDAAVVIAENLAGSEEAFAKLMTARARRLGMKNTTFRNASGLPDAGQKTTSYDLLVLARSILRDFPEQAGLFKTKFFKFRNRLYKNHNALLFSYPGAEGMKTGFTNASGFNLMTTARRDGKFLIGVVIGGRSGKHRNETMRNLLNAAWKRAVPEAKLIAARQQMLAKRQRKPAPDGGAVHVAAAKPHEASPAVKSMMFTANAQHDAGPPGQAVKRSLPASAANQAPSEPPALKLAETAPRQPVKISAAIAAPAYAGPVHTADLLSGAGKAQGGDFPGPYHIQVGAYDNFESAHIRLDDVSKAAADILSTRPHFIMTGKSGDRDIVRARFGGFSRLEAERACEALRMRAIDCLVMNFTGSGL